MIIPANIKSHIFPILSFVSTYFPVNYELYWCVDSKMKHLFIKEENVIILDEGRVIPTFNFYEYEYIVGKFIFFLKKSFELIKSFFSRKAKLKRIINCLNPDVIFIDIFSSTDILLINNLSTKIVTFSPMLSVENNLIYKKPFSKIEYLFMKIFVQLSGNDINNISIISHSVIRKSGIREIVLAPFELEKKEKKEVYQDYVGLCVNENIVEECEFYFPLNQVNNKLILCSFGTYSVGIEELNIILNFIHKIIKTFKNDKRFTVIISAGSFLIDVLKKDNYDSTNIYIYPFIPQLEVLKYSNLFITHGGLGSIKEAIRFGVPMLVCPLDTNWDNYYNAKCIEQLGLGLQCDINGVVPSELEKKSNQILFSTEIQENICSISEKINAKYNRNFISEIILRNFSTDE